MTRTRPVNPVLAFLRRHYACDEWRRRFRGVRTAAAALRVLRGLSEQEQQGAVDWLVDHGWAPSARVWPTLPLNQGCFMEGQNAWCCNHQDIGQVMVRLRASDLRPLLGRRAR